MKDLSGFIGEGAHIRMSQNQPRYLSADPLLPFDRTGLATCLPRLGLTLESLDAFIDRPERAPAHEAMAALKEARLKASGSANRETSTYDTIFGPSGPGGNKDGRGDDGNAAGPSKKRGLETYPGSQDHGSGVNGGGGGGSGSGPKRARTQDIPLSRTSSNQSHGESPPAHGRYNRPHSQSTPNPTLQDYTTGPLAGLPDPSSSLSSHQSQAQAQVPAPRQSETELMEAQQAQALQRTMMRAMENAEGRQQEAMQLVGYHLTKSVGRLMYLWRTFELIVVVDSYRQNPNYFLPPSLRPTLIQKSIPHGQSTLENSSEDVS